MKTVSITEAKKSLRQIIGAAEPVHVTVHGQQAATLRVIAQPVVDREKAMAAAKRIAELSRGIKPNPRNGGAAAVRRLRDRGE